MSLADQEPEKSRAQGAWGGPEPASREVPQSNSQTEVGQGKKEKFTPWGAPIPEPEAETDWGQSVAAEAGRPWSLVSQYLHSFHNILVKAFLRWPCGRHLLIWAACWPCSIMEEISPYVIDIEQTLVPLELSHQWARILVMFSRVQAFMHYGRLWHKDSQAEMTISMSLHAPVWTRSSNYIYACLYTSNLSKFFKAENYSFDYAGWGESPPRQAPPVVPQNSWVRSPLSRQLAVTLWASWFVWARLLNIFLPIGSWSLHISQLSVAILQTAPAPSNTVKGWNLNAQEWKGSSTGSRPAPSLNAAAAQFIPPSRYQGGVPQLQMCHAN